MRIVAILVLLAGLTAAARADVPTSAEQVELCYELGERGPYYRECKTESFLRFVKRCGIKPVVTIDPGLMKALPNGVTSFVDALLGPLVSQCDPGFYRKARNLIRAKVKGVHLKLVACPPKDENGNYPRQMKLENGVIEEGLCAIPKSEPDAVYGGPELDKWLFTQILGNERGTESERDEAGIAEENAIEKDHTPPPEPTPAQQKRIAKLLTRQGGGGGNANACKPAGYFCGKNDPHAKCCSGVCDHGMNYDKCK